MGDWAAQSGAGIRFEWGLPERTASSRRPPA